LKNKLLQVLNNSQVLRCLLLGIVGLILAASPLGLDIDRAIYDAQLQFLSKHSTPSNIVIVTIDDVSLDVLAEQVEGLYWPFPRRMHAEVIKNLKSLGVKAVYIDIIFDLPSRFGKSDDEQFLESLDLMPVVLAAEHSPQVITPPAAGLVTDSPVQSVWAPRGVKKITIGAKPANAYLPMDADGLIRTTPGAKSLPSGFLTAITYFLGFDFASTKITTNTVERLPTPSNALYQEIYGRLEGASGGFINFLGPAGTLSRIPYFEAYNSELLQNHRAKLHDSIVLIGASPSVSITPTQAADLYLTPFSEAWMSGVEIHANVLATLMSGNFRQLISSPLFLISYLTFVGLFGWLSIRFTKPETLIAAGVILLIAIEVVVGSAFVAGIVVPVMPFVLFAILLFFEQTVRRYVVERDGRLLIRGQFFRYLPERVANYLIEHPDRMAMDGDRAEITVIFADLAGFTTLSERLPATEVVALLQEHVEEMTMSIFDHDGTLDKFLGDGLMAFWGAPVAQPKQASLAVDTAIDMLKRLEIQNEVRLREGRQTLRMRLGIHTGEATVGNIGSSRFMVYAALGDTVNTAARVETANKHFKTSLAISSETYAQLPEVVARSFHLLGRVVVKGRQKPIELFVHPERVEVESYQRLNRYLLALEDKDEAKASQILSALAEHQPAFGPLAFYQDRGGKFSGYDDEGNGFFVLNAV